MTAIVVDGSTPFGALSNKIAQELNQLSLDIARLRAAEAQAASGFGGTAGTEFETGTNFGVVPASGSPGAQGTAWRFQVDSLGPQWDTFWAAAKPFVAALDNG